ncbi:MAG: ATP synthase F1 subunit delta [Gemmatimonadales bacterium]|nr:MAG: ATP synthase F1 subunit delta [Gemmatimonadales bacterium]
MRGETIARNYAEALFELGRRHEALQEFGDGLEVVADILDENRDLGLFLETPRIQADEKKRVLREAFEGRVPPLLVNFLLLVVDKRRQRYLSEMATAYQHLLDTHMGRTRVDVQVAREVSDEEATEIGRRLSDLLEMDAITRIRVRPELIGGILFRSGDTIFDGSVRRRLQRMRRSLMTADVGPEPGTP